MGDSRPNADEGGARRATNEKSTLMFKIFLFFWYNAIAKFEFMYPIVAVITDHEHSFTLTGRTRKEMLTMDLKIFSKTKASSRY